jgi:2-C-methyl-D-erythritol 4-phosphate cytidylyltransferase
LGFAALSFLAVRRFPYAEPYVSFWQRFAYNGPMNTAAIILAGGAGARFNSPEPKQFLEMNGRTLLEICLQRFQDHSRIDGIVLVCPAEHLALAQKIATAFSKVANVLAGGASRQESSAIGVGAVPAAENILIHDAARALVPNAVIDRVLDALASARAVMPVLAVDDTAVRIDDAGTVAAVLDRGVLRRAQTPQGFKLDVIRGAHEMARSEKFADASDDCSLVLRTNLAPVVTVEGDPRNIKITYPLDLILAESILNVHGLSGNQGQRQKAKGKR